MPTSSKPTHDVHQAASDGYAIASKAYARGRPDYPQEISAWLASSLGLRDGKTVIDLGAGTGKFTRRLIATGATVIAVEPVAQMLEKLRTELPSAQALEGSATRIPVPDNSVDAVVCAQSFHWFATTQALDEIHRVLKPGGQLGLVWNLRDDREAWVRQLNAIVDQVEGDAPRYATGAWRRVFPAQGFGPLQEQYFSNMHRGSAEDVILNRVRSTSFIAALPEPIRKHIESQVKALIATEPALREKEIVAMPYTTAAYNTMKST
ncbi:class I SAM-dependent methyltransferase [Comamonas odontotermitis]|uniref:class I SAM-dependent methyltransferase n=1 Tax=Comamonas odontotermitis TaxID=379895 RepID=UPI0037535F32